MMRLQQKLPREKFQEIIRPMVRAIGSKNVIIRLNEAAKIAIPRQTKLDQLMPKLELLCYEQNRPKVDEEIERLWNLYFESRLGESGEKFVELSDELNKHLEGENVSKDPEKRALTEKAIDAIAEYLPTLDFGEDEVEAVFRLRAYPEVMGLYLERKASVPKRPARPAKPDKA
jgi:hypothetical protein